MRLWTIAPEYLDTKGLTAAWREGLLAQKVLSGKTKGYRNHPQLERFKKARDPIAAIGNYLAGILREAENRGYGFDARKILRSGGSRIAVNAGQVAYEWRHLRMKIKKRDGKKYAEIRTIRTPGLNRAFRTRKGPVEKWEKGKS